MALIARATRWLRHDLWLTLKTRASSWLREAIDALTPPRERIQFEALEPRLLMSSDLVPLAGAIGVAAPEASAIVQRASISAANPSVWAGYSVSVAPAAATGREQISTLPKVSVAAPSPAPLVAVRPAALAVPPTDPDGTTPTVTVTGAGSAELAVVEGGYTLTLKGTDGSSKVELTASGGDNRIALKGVTAESAVAALDLASADLRGATVTLVGGTTSLVLGDAVDSHLSAGETRLALVAASWTGAGSGVAVASLSKLAIGNPKDGGAFDGALVVGHAASSGVVLDGVNISGAASGQWSVNGRSNAVQIGSTSASWHANFSGPVTQLYVRGDAAGLIAAPAIQVLQVGGSMTGLTVLIGANLGADAAVGGAGDNADSYKAGTLARLRVAGDVSDSQVLVGVDPVGGTVLGGAANRVQELVVGGALKGSTRIVAPVFPATVRVGGQSVTPGSLSALQTQLPDTIAPTLSAALRSDTGSSASDALTKDPALLLQASDAGGIAGFEARLGTGTYQSIAATSTAGGYLVDAAALTALNGGSLPDGAYAVELRAIDNAGNRSTPRQSPSRSTPARRRRAASGWPKLPTPARSAT